MREFLGKGICFIVMLTVGSYGKELNKELNVNLQQSCQRDMPMGK